MKQGRLGSLIAGLAAISLMGASGPASARGGIANFQILSRTPAWGGATPSGAAGPYEVITGVVHGTLDPAAPANAGIVDLKHAPVGTDGWVSYQTAVVILRPMHAADARRLLFYDVVNRGRKLGLGTFVGGGALTGKAAPPASFPSLLRSGATVVWSGWQGDLPMTGTPAIAGDAAIATEFPIAHEAGGKPITGISREEYIPDYAGGPPNTIALEYPPADPADTSAVSFTARQSWEPHYGAVDPKTELYTAPSVPVSTWHYASDGQGQPTVIFTPPAAVPGPGGKLVPPDAGTIYSFVYRARDPRVNGIGFAAVRDLISFLRHGAPDGAGHPNPLADFKGARCLTAACPAHPGDTVDLAFGEGISQSGRFLRDFLYQGFNTDTAGRRVFDGLLPIIAGARRTWVNDRFSQPGRWSKQHEDHWQHGDQFPFTYATTTDPVSGRTGGLLERCTAHHDCPLIMQVDGAFEWWGARAALVVTDGRGHDLTLPENVRYYLVAGTMHNGGAGVISGLETWPKTGSLCQFPSSPVAEQPVYRALAEALIDWAATSKPPPRSQYPTVAAGTLVAPTQAATGFPDLSDAVVPSSGGKVTLHLKGVGLINPIAVTDYSHAVPQVNAARAYDVLVPKVDATGNETSGIRVPDVSVPLASYTGWNLRGAGHAIGEGCYLYGAALPLAVDDAAKAGGHDSRPALADLYHGRADYQAKVAAAAKVLVKQGYLLPDDAVHVFEAHAAKVSPILLPAP